MISLKGWSKGKGRPHFEKHALAMGFANVIEYTRAAKEFAKKTEGVVEEMIGNLSFKYDGIREWILIVNVKDRTIKTFYPAENGLASFEDALQKHRLLLESLGDQSGT